MVKHTSKPNDPQRGLCGRAMVAGLELPEQRPCGSCARLAAKAAAPKAAPKEKPQPKRHLPRPDAGKAYCGRPMTTVADGTACRVSDCANPATVLADWAAVLFGKADGGETQPVCDRHIPAGDVCGRCQGLADKATAPKAAPKEKPQPKRHLPREGSDKALCGRGATDGTGELCGRCAVLDAKRQAKVSPETPVKVSDPVPAEVIEEQRKVQAKRDKVRKSRKVTATVSFPEAARFEPTAEATLYEATVFASEIRKGDVIIANEPWTVGRVKGEDNGFRLFDTSKADRGWWGRRETVPARSARFAARSEAVRCG